MEYVLVDLNLSLSKHFFVFALADTGLPSPYYSPCQPTPMHLVRQSVAQISRIIN